MLFRRSTIMLLQLGEQKCGPRKVDLLRSSADSRQQDNWYVRLCHHAADEQQLWQIQANCQAVP